MMFRPKNKKLIIIPLIFLIIGVFFLWYKNSSNKFLSAGPNSTKHQEILAPAINGMLVSPEIAQKRPLAVIVENHPDARPQSGLGEADIVYETLAEGGITRFLAIFQTKETQSIGPVRSARDYFAEIANDFEALFAHVGGSDEVLLELQNKQYKNLDDINQFYQSSFFERVKLRPAPHNVYTSTEKLRDYLDSKKLKKDNSFTSWQFEETKNLATEIITASSIEIPFSLPSYKVVYNYNKTKNDYSRSMAGLPHLDATTKQQIQVKNILIQYVNITSLPDDPKLHINIQLSGSGTGLLFKDGKSTPITWTKTNSKPTEYIDSNGQTLKLNRGPTWVELVPQTNKVTWKGN